MTDRYEARRRANGYSLAHARASRRNSPRIRLTQRGENVVVALYTLAALLGWGLLLLVTLGVAGWIETHP